MSDIGAILVTDPTDGTSSTKGCVMSKKRKMPDYLFWRGRTLWTRAPLRPGIPRWSLGIQYDGTPADKKKCEREGVNLLALLRVKEKQGKLEEFFDIKEKKEPYRPLCWMIIARYFVYRLKCNKHKKAVMRRLLKYFGRMYWDEVDQTVVERWMEGMRAEGLEVNSVNTYLAMLQAAFQYAVEVRKPVRSRADHPVEGDKIPYNTPGMVKPLPDGNVRQFVLTEKLFERNYRWLQEHYPWFSTLYLAIWMLGRRPLELCKWSWERFQEFEVKGVLIHAIGIPSKDTKKKVPDYLPIPPRLWDALVKQAELNRAGFVFRNSLGRQMKTWSWIMDALEKAFPGEDVGWCRDGRRGFATHHVQVLGEDRSTVKSISGQRSDSMFDRYCIEDIRSKLVITHKEKFKKGGVEVQKEVQRITGTE